LTVFEFDSLLNKSDYELTVRERDSAVIYDYRNKTDSTKNISFRYLKYSDRLFAGSSEFNKIEADRYPEIANFDFYGSDPGIADGMGPVIFNKKYGILGFDSMGTNYYFTTDKTENIALPILYGVKNLESSVVGNWRLKNPKFYDEFHLFENNIWRHTFENHKNDTIIKKGKYTIAKDSAIFFRYFGSQHWPNKDTINDYKTSIGSFVLFLNFNNKLVDNQEDYHKSYEKIE